MYEAMSRSSESARIRQELSSCIRNLERCVRKLPHSEEEEEEEEETTARSMGFMGFSDSTPFSRVKASSSASTCKRCDFYPIGEGRRTLCDRCALNKTGSSSRSSKHDDGGSKPQQPKKCTKCNWRYVGEGRRTQCDYCAEHPKSNSASLPAAKKKDSSAGSSGGGEKSRPKCNRCEHRYVGEGRRTLCDYCAEHPKTNSAPPSTKKKDSGGGAGGSKKAAPQQQKSRPKCDRCEYRYVGEGRRTLCDYCAEHPKSNSNTGASTASSSRKTTSSAKASASRGSEAKSNVKCNKCNYRYVAPGRRTLCNICAK